MLQIMLYIMLIMSLNNARANITCLHGGLFHQRNDIRNPLIRFAASSVFCLFRVDGEFSIFFYRYTVCTYRDSSVRFLSSGFSQQWTSFGPLITFPHFLRIRFRIHRVIRIRNSYCATGHCGGPNFFCRYHGFKTWVVQALPSNVYIRTLSSITVPLKDMASF